jgi:hypothetical protein
MITKLVFNILKLFKLLKKIYNKIFKNKINFFMCSVIKSNLKFDKNF